MKHEMTLFLIIEGNLKVLKLDPKKPKVTNLRSKIFLFFQEDLTEMDRGLKLLGRTSVSKVRKVTNIWEIASFTK